MNAVVHQAEEEIGVLDKMGLRQKGLSVVGVEKPDRVVFKEELRIALPESVDRMPREAFMIPKFPCVMPYVCNGYLVVGGEIGLDRFLHGGPEEPVVDDIIAFSSLCVPKEVFVQSSQIYPKQIEVSNLLVSEEEVEPSLGNVCLISTADVAVVNFLVVPCVIGALRAAKSPLFVVRIDATGIQ